MGKIRADEVNKEVSTSINSSVRDTCCSFKNLYKAMEVSKKNVIWKDSVAGFVKNGLKNCYNLHNELINNTYKISKYSVFTIIEKKTRIIVSTRMRDRVVQRSLCDNYLYNELTKGFIYDNGACIKGKGTDFSRNRLKHHLQKFYRKHGTNGFYCKIDIHNYFGSTPHWVAKEAIQKRVHDEWAKQMVFDVIDSFVPIFGDRGIGLGSLISLLVLLAVLDDIDHLIKEKLHILYYDRYMDDFILIHESKEYLEYCLSIIISELQKIELQINKNKTTIQPLTHGILFLGFSYRLTENGGIKMRVIPGTISKNRKALKKLLSIVNPENFYECYSSRRLHMKKGIPYHLLCDMDENYLNIFNYE